MDDDIETTMNVFERVCGLLDIKMIKAYSPQADDFTVRFNNKFYQLDKKQETKLRSKDAIVIHVHLNGQMSLWKNNRRLTYKEATEAKVAEQEVKKECEYTSADRSVIAKKNKHKSPWSRCNKEWLTSSSFA